MRWASSCGSRRCLPETVPWTHHLIILSQAKPVETREFFILAAIKERWSKRELERQIRSGAVLREAKSAKKVSPAVTQFHPTAIDEFKNAYSIEFLGLAADHSEADLRGALLRNLGLAPSPKSARAQPKVCSTPLAPRSFRRSPPRRTDVTPRERLTPRDFLAAPLQTDVAPRPRHVDLPPKHLPYPAPPASPPCSRHLTPQQKPRLPRLQPNRSSRDRSPRAGDRESSCRGSNRTTYRAVVRSARGGETSPQRLTSLGHGEGDGR